MNTVKKYGRVGVLMGGPSSEREISLKSGNAVFEALSGLGVDVTALDIVSADPGETAALLKSSALDCAFIAMHGSFGEDGQLQQLLEDLKMPYTGSGPAASRLAMDKERSREVFVEHGLNVAEGVIARRGRDVPLRAMLGLGFPLVIKPVTQGSSIGLSIIDAPDQLEGALSKAFGYDERVLAEKYIRGRELTVGVLGEQALQVIEIAPAHRFFDFEAKYQQGLTEYIVPARLPADVSGLCRETARNAHDALGCSGCSRTDLILDERGGLFVLEVNTIPGMTATSLLPKAARLEGIEFPRLCLRLLESAYEKK